MEGLSHDPKIARLHNICLPRIFADDGFKHRHLLKKSHENDKSEATINKVDDVEERDESGPTTTCGVEEIENFADVVGEDEFRASYLPENRGAEMAINFISARSNPREEEICPMGPTQMFNTEFLPRNIWLFKHKTMGFCI